MMMYMEIDMSNAMIRKQIYLSRRQNQFLKRRARQQGITEAEVIRQAIDLEEKLSTPSTRADAAGWEKIQRFVQERQAKYAGKGKPVRWNRQELYEEDDQKKSEGK
jgi:hypothetical protein